jgi:hypothetical protein
VCEERAVTRGERREGGGERKEGEREGEKYYMYLHG